MISVASAVNLFLKIFNKQYVFFHISTFNMILMKVADMFVLVHLTLFGLDEEISQSDIFHINHKGMTRGGGYIALTLNLALGSKYVVLMFHCIFVQVSYNSPRSTTCPTIQWNDTVLHMSKCF